MPSQKRQILSSSSTSTSASTSTSTSSSNTPTLTPKRPRTSSGSNTPMAAISFTTDDKHEKYTEWAVSKSITISSVAPLALPGRGIGLLATANITADSKLIFVPEKAMIKSSPSFLKKHTLLKASPQAQLAAYLTLASREEPQQPEWYTQSRAVWPTPDDFRACMLAWSSGEELESLKGVAPPSILSPLERLLLDLQKDREAVGHLMPTSGEADSTGGIVGDEVDDDKASWEQGFIYHWILVNTRSFHWKPHGVREGSMVMCPFLDYMNHCPNGKGCTVQVSTAGYELRADREYNSGDEILATYGAHPNDKLLVHYGFILPESPDDEIRLDHVILPRLSESQQSILQDVGFLGGYALDPSTNELCFKTQVAIRSVLLTANEWEHYMGSGEDLASDKDADVVEWLRPALEGYVQEAEEAIENIQTAQRQRKTSRGPCPAFESKLELLSARWEQIREALERFLDPMDTA